jgi:hypothetical protein
VPWDRPGLGFEPDPARIEARTLRKLALRAE